MIWILASLFWNTVYICRETHGVVCDRSIWVRDFSSAPWMQSLDYSISIALPRWSHVRCTGFSRFHLKPLFVADELRVQTSAPCVWLMYDVVEKPSTRRRSAIPCVFVEKKHDASTWRQRRKKYKNVDEYLIKNSCDLFTAIMYIKLPVAYLIISYKKWCVSIAQNYNSKTVDDLTIALVPIETWLEEKLTWTVKRKTTTYKKVTENSDASSKTLKSESKTNYDAVETSSKKSQSESKKFDAIDVELCDYGLYERCLQLMLLMSKHFRNDQVYPSVSPSRLT